MRKKKLFRLPSLIQWIELLFGLVLFYGGVNGFNYLVNENRESVELCSQVFGVWFLLVEGVKLLLRLPQSLFDDREETEK